MAIYDSSLSRGQYSGSESISILNNSIEVNISDEENNATSVIEDGIYTIIPEYIGLYPLLEINTYGKENGIELTIQNGDTVLNATSDSNGYATISIPSFGTWNISCTIDGDLLEKSILISQSQIYKLSITTTNCFGVKWDGSSNTQLSRLTPNNDPYNYTTVEVTEEPQIGIGTDMGSSIFDSYLPWSGMEEYNIVDNIVKYKYGDGLFSREKYDTVVFIPEFYYKIIQNGSTIYFYVSNNQIADFTLHPGSNCYVGRYTTSPGYFSKTNTTSLVQITREAARTGSRNKGTGWYQYDYMSWCAIWLLYLVEFADWNSQAKIGLGGSSSTTILNGATDKMNYHTGYYGPNGNVSEGLVQYRHIESPWGKVWQWLDGANLLNNIFYICENPDAYLDKIYSGFYKSSNVGAMSSGYTTKITISKNFNYGFFPTTTGGSSSTYIPDNLYAGSTQCMVGGSYSSYQLGTGLFCLACNYGIGESGGHIGSRLKFIQGA